METIIKKLKHEKTNFNNIFDYSFKLFSQTEYYSTNGKNRLTKAELDLKTSELKTKYKKISNKEAFVKFNIDNTETKTDSIIHFVKFEIKDTNAFKGPLSEYVGKKLPEMILTDINGKKIPINKLNGKPTLINFWFTACAPCIDEMPILNKIYDEYKEKYNFIAVTYESQKQVDKFLKKHLYKFLHIVDAREFTDKLQLKSYPVNLFLDKNGIVIYSEYGIPYERGENGKLKIGDGKDFIKKLEKLK